MIWSEHTTHQQAKPQIIYTNDTEPQLRLYMKIKDWTHVALQRTDIVSMEMRTEIDKSMAEMDKSMQHLTTHGVLADKTVDWTQVLAILSLVICCLLAIGFAGQVCYIKHYFRKSPQKSIKYLETGLPNTAAVYGTPNTTHKLEIYKVWANTIICELWLHATDEWQIIKMNPLDQFR